MNSSFCPRGICVRLPFGTHGNEELIAHRNDITLKTSEQIFTDPVWDPCFLPISWGNSQLLRWPTICKCNSIRRLPKRDFFLHAPVWAETPEYKGQLLVSSSRHKTTRPGPLKCFCAPSHQILAKSAPQKARDRDNAEFATKLRKLSKLNHEQY